MRRWLGLDGRLFGGCSATGFTKGKGGEVLAGVRKEMNFVCRVIGPVTGQSQSQPALI